MELTRREMLATAASALAVVPGCAAARPSPANADDFVDAQGDSLTIGWGSHGDGPGEGPYPLQLEALLLARYGRPIRVDNHGVGGVGARTCSALSNGQPMHFAVAGDMLPASGPVALGRFDSNPITEQNPAPLPGTYAGVHGTLAVAVQKPKFDYFSMTFTRDRPGPPLPVAPMSVFYSDVGVATRRHAKLMVYGRNGQKLDPIVAAIDGDIAYQDAIHKRWLVGSVMTAVTEIGTDTQARIHAINVALAARYGRHFVDLNSSPTSAEMRAIGFVPDAAGPYPGGRTDREALAAGVLPPGMRKGGTDNNQHLNNHGYALWARRFDTRIAELGWFANRRG